MSNQNRINISFLGETNSKTIFDLNIREFGSYSEITYDTNQKVYDAVVGDCNHVRAESTVIQSSPAIQQTTFSDFITFGDSLADVGNVFLSTRGRTPASPPYCYGRFSNGELVPEIIARKLGLSASIPFLAGGDNYAFGTAETGYGVSDEGLPNVGEQIKFYLARDAPIATDVFFISAGSNNFFPDINTEITTQNISTPENVLQGLIENITALANAGAENFIIPNLAPLGTTPFAKDAGISDALNAASAKFNHLLDKELDELEDELGISIIELDIAGEIAQIKENPSDFGFNNIEAPAHNKETGTVVSTPSQYFWWDDVHPTATVYSLIAQDIFDYISQATNQFTTINIESLSIDYNVVWEKDDKPSPWLCERTDLVFNYENNNFAVGETNQVDKTNNLNMINIGLPREFTKDLFAVREGVKETQLEEEFRLYDLHTDDVFNLSLAQIR